MKLRQIKSFFASFSSEKEGFFFLKKKKQKTSVLLVALVWPGWGAFAGEDEGRDFPKTLIFDEPGIDDEISLPTVQVAGQETDVDLELDKRLTNSVSVQINVGYTALGRAGGWQNSSATLKFLGFVDRANEQLVSVSLVHEFGGTGAPRIGAAEAGSSALALNFGQGFASVVASPWLKPFAVTGVAGFSVPDSPRRGAVQQALLSASLQYSFDVPGAGGGIPVLIRPLIPIMEATYAAPVQGQSAAHGILAPGLIYAGEGYQVAAEALLPLTRASGTHLGVIAQLNISLAIFGTRALTRPVF